MDDVASMRPADAAPSDPSRARAPRGARAIAFLLDAGVAAFCVLPLLLTAHLPLVDLPNHLARQYVIRDLATSPPLQQFYRVTFAFVPNLGLEGFLFLVGDAMSIDMGVRVFCIATLLMLFFGTRLINLHFSQGRSRLYLVTPLLCYGGPFQYGFLSFCFGIGLALLAFGAWLRCRPATPGWIALGFAATAFLLLLCHLAAFGLFAAAVGACAAAEALRPGWQGAARRVLRAEVQAGCWLVPPFALFLLFSPTSGAGHGVRFSTLQDKIESVAAITLFSAPAIELALLMLAAAGLGVALLAGRVRFCREGLFILAAQGALWAILPRVALAGGYIDYRMPWAISFFLLACLVPVPVPVPAPVAVLAPVRVSRRGGLGRMLAMLFGALVTLRVVSICVLWLSWEPVLAAIDQALTTLPVGARLMVVRGRLPSASLDRRPALNHVAAYAVARRQAYEPEIFADISGQILHLQPAYAHRWADAPDRLDRLPPDADYVLVLRPAQARLAPDLPLTCTVAGVDFALFRLDASERVRIGPAPLAGCP